MKQVGSEAELRRMLARWLQLQYPNVIYRFDLGADLKLTIGQARKHKELHPKRGYPDLFIAEPRSCYHGMYVELKADGKSPYKRNGELRAGQHLEEQEEFLMKLNCRGYYATFATGFEDAKHLIELYLNKKLRGGKNEMRGGTIPKAEDCR